MGAPGTAHPAYPGGQRLLCVGLRSRERVALAEAGSLPRQASWALLSGWPPEQVCWGIDRLSFLKIEAYSLGVSQVWLQCMHTPVLGLHRHTPTAEHRPRGPTDTHKDTHVSLHAHILAEAQPWSRPLIHITPSHHTHTPPYTPTHTQQLLSLPT